MTEWKAAGYVFSVIAVIAIGIALYLNRTQHLTLAYNGCKVDYAYKGEVDTSGNNEYYNLERQFGECLCKSYLKHPDSIAAKMIVKMGSRSVYELHIDSPKYATYANLDSILKYRAIVFRPIGWDD